MGVRAISVGLVFGLGILLLLAAAGFVAYAQLSPAQGLRDLARVVGALVLTAAGGALLGGSLLLAWALRVRPGGWRLAIATFGAILGAIVGFGFLGSAIPGNLWLGLFSGIVVLLAVGGLVASVRLWRGGAMTA